MAESIPDDAEKALLLERQCQQRRIQQLLPRVRLPHAWDYVNEGALCFAVGAYDAAVVMCWNAVMCYYRTLARERHAVFQWAYSWYRQERSTGSDEGRYRSVTLVSVTEPLSDADLINACERMGYFAGVEGVLHELRELRHRCAHPGVLSVDRSQPVDTVPVARPTQIVRLFELAVEQILSQDLSSDESWRALKGQTLVEYLTSVQAELNSGEVDEALDMLSRSQFSYAANKMRAKLVDWTMSGAADGVDVYLQYRNMKAVWCALYTQLGLKLKADQLRKLSDEMLTAVDKRLTDTDGHLRISLIQPGAKRRKWPPSPERAAQLAQLLVLPHDAELSEEWKCVYEALIEVVEAALSEHNAGELRNVVKPLVEDCPEPCLQRMQTIRNRINEAAKV